jgi:regulatory protein
MDIKAAIFHYCDYQERCHSEVRNKLYELGARHTEVEAAISDLIEANLLNEERFAQSYARGKFRMKQWGRVKIINELKHRKVSEYCIKKAMKQIDASEYFDTALKLANKKWKETKERHPATRKAKVYRYLLQKGYEANIIREAIEENLVGRE